MHKGALFLNCFLLMAAKETDLWAPGLFLLVLVLCGLQYMPCSVLATTNTFHSNLGNPQPPAWHGLVVAQVQQGSSEDRGLTFVP